MATPTVYPGLESGYTSSVVVIRQLEAHLDMTDPDDFPLLKRVGLNSYPEAITNVKFEWNLDNLVPITDVLGVAITSTSATQFTVTYAEYFALHDVVMLDSELCRVVGVDATNNYINVERGFAGSTAATHLISITVYRLGAARPEGSSPGWAQQVLTTQPYNYTQIFDAVVSITGTQEAMRNYAPDDLMAYRLDKRLKELYMMMERSLIYGLRYQPSSTNTGRMSGGLTQYVTDTNNISSAAVTFDDLEDALEDVFGRAGLANVPADLWCNSWVKRKISSWGAGSIRTGRTESVVGNEITVVSTNFGNLAVNLDHLIIASEAWLLDMPRIQCGPLQGRGLKEIDATIPGEDLMRTRVIGEYGFVVKGEDGTNDGTHVKLYGISTTE